MRPRTISVAVLGLSILVMLVAALFVSGCSEAGDQGGKGLTPTPSIQRITVTGSTTVLPIAEKAKDAFEKRHINADIQISGGGSSVGVKAVGEGTADIGISSRDLKSEENAIYPDLVKHEIAIDAIVIIVHPSNPVEALSLDQVRGIFNGTFTNWKDLGGKDGTIVVVGRDSASGTREYFFEAVMKKENFTTRQEEFNSNGGIQQKVMQTPGAIGYVGLAYTANVKALKIQVKEDRIEPTMDNLLQKKYPISRPLFMLTKGEPRGLAKDYLEFILSPECQGIVAEAGFVPIR
ncbi:MAG: phosphate ABC transporter substrate-binding protein [Methanomicrobiales archaeon]|nr:phosphate ABC transporter substrate-binding protein [Methanomicrobiales archaeon]